MTPKSVLPYTKRHTGKMLRELLVFYKHGGKSSRNWQASRWSRENLDFIMMSCIILHNMIVEDERDRYIDGESDDDQDDPNRSRRARAKIYDVPNLPFNPRIGSIFINEYMKRYRMIRSHATNKHQQQDLVAHLWAKRSME
ncbi:hypothetical protein PS2_016588 [Malus domestica]